MRNATSDYDKTVFFADAIESVDASRIDDGFERTPQASPGFYEQVCAAADDTGTAVVVAQYIKRFGNRSGRVVLQ